MVDLTPRAPADSFTTMTEIVYPTHANALGTVFGGQVLAWMDICGAICAQRHCRSVMVTAGVDELSFENPIHVGQVVCVEARMNAAFHKSVEVEVIVRGEHPLTRASWPCVRAFVTFVALDASGATIAVPPLLITNNEEKLRQDEAVWRRGERLKRRVIKSV